MPGMQKAIIGVIIVTTLIVGGVWYWHGGSAQSYNVQIDSRDSIEDWHFQGSHADGGELEQRVRDEISRLQAGLEDEEQEPTDYSLYVGIAGQYTLLGDGEKTLEYLEKALAIDSTKTGLAWYNVAVLMERLGALNTARTAYARAVESQGVDAYHVARLNFLIKYFAEDQEAFKAALAEAEAVYGVDSVFVLQARAQWLEKLGMTREAITAWNSVRAVVPDEIKPSVDEQIRRLEAKI